MILLCIVCFIVGAVLGFIGACFVCLRGARWFLTGK